MASGLQMGFCVIDLAKAHQLRDRSLSEIWVLVPLCGVSYWSKWFWHHRVYNCSSIDYDTLSIA